MHFRPMYGGTGVVREALTFALVALAVATSNCGGAVAEHSSAGPTTADRATHTPLPPRPDGAVRAGQRKLWVVKRIAFGTDDASADIGFDFDGLKTSPADSEAGNGACILPDRAGLLSFADGTDGRDNNFGRIVVRNLETASGGRFEESCNEVFARESTSTTMFQVDGITPDGENSLAAIKIRAVFLGADGAKSVSGVGSADIASAYLTGRHVYADVRSTSLPMCLAGYCFSLPLDALRIDIDLSTSVANLGGVAAANDIAIHLPALAATVGLCPDTVAYRMATGSAEPGADLALTPTHRDQSQQCDAISIGLRLTLREVSTAPAGAAAASPPSCG